MTRKIHNMLGLAALLACGAVTAWAAEPDPRGKPDGVEPGQTARWYVWHDDDGWHVRTTTKAKQHQFMGMIRGGGIETITAARLENTGQSKDWWGMSEGNKVVTLNLKTN